MSSYNHLDVSERNGLTIVRFKGDPLLVDESIVYAVSNEFQTWWIARCRKLIVNFLGVADLSNLMLGLLVMLRKKLAAKRGQLVLCGLSPEVREFLDETMLSQLFEIRETEADACSAFACGTARAG